MTDGTAPRAWHRALSWAFLPAVLGLALGASAPVQAQTFSAVLSGAAEVPAVESIATGRVTAALDGTTLTVSGSFSGLASDFDTSIGAHIHSGARGSNGPVVFPLAVALDGDRRGGSFAAEANTLTLTEEQVAALRQGLYYVNVHTETNPAGEIRGRLGLDSTAPLTIVGTDDPTAFAFTGFRGVGFSETPGPGQLDSRYFSITGLTGGPIDFGGEATSGQHAQGANTGRITSGGIYAYDDGVEQWLFVQPTGTAFNPGTLTMRFQNAFDEAVEGVSFAYDIKVMNDVARASTFNLSYSLDGLTFTALPEADYTVPQAADEDPMWQTIPRSVELAGVSIEPGDYVYFRFSSQDVGGSGGRPELGLDNLRVAVLEGGTNPGSLAYVQVIHNSPDPAAASVDIYVGAASNDAAAIIAGAPTFAGVAFRAATGFTALPAGDYRVVITAPGGDTALLDQEVTLTEGLVAQAIASGVADPSAFPANPDGRDTGLTLLINADARQSAADPGAVNVTAIHGAPDAPTVSVRAGEATLFGPFAYGDISDVVSAAPGAVVLDVVAGETIAARFAVDLSPLAGAAVTVLASGLLSPDQGPEGTPAFGLLAVAADGTSFLLSPIVDIATARSLPLGSSVTVEGTVSRARGAFSYLQDETAGLAIRQTSSPWQAAVVDGTITEGTRVRVTGLTSEFRGLVQINQVSATNNQLASFEILGQGEAPEAVPVTLAELTASGETYESRLVRVTDLEVTTEDESFRPAFTYAVTDPSIMGTFDLRIPNAADTEVDGTEVPEGLFTFEGVIGQFTPTAQGPADQGYQLLAIEAGDIQPQAAMPVALVQVIHNAPDPAFAEVDVYLNGALGLEGFAFRAATPFLEVPLAATVGIAPAGSESAEDAVFTATYELEEGGVYQLIASGLNEEGDRAFAVLVNAEARTTGTGEEGTVDVNFVHGTPDAPAVVVGATNIGLPLMLFEASYGEIEPYRTISAQDYLLNVAGGAVGAEFAVDLTALAGGAATALASGLLDPSAVGGGEGQAFGLLLVLPDGQTAFVEPRGVSSEPGGQPVAFAVEGNFPNPFNATTTLRYSLPSEAEVRVAVYDLLGRQVLATTAVTVGAGADHALALEANGLAAGTYLWRLTADAAGESFSQTGRMTVVR
jgi:hypothetical protein